MRPTDLDALAFVLFLLRPQGEVDKHLLELLVDVVDAELLETVHIEDLEPVDIQDSYAEQLVAVAVAIASFALAFSPAGAGAGWARGGGVCRLLPTLLQLLVAPLDDEIEQPGIRIVQSKLHYSFASRLVFKRT